MTTVHKVVVLGDPCTGKTSLCRRLQSPDRFGAKGWSTNQEYFVFDVALPQNPPTSSPKNKDGWVATDVTGSETRIKISVVDQPGADRFSLQPIVFRKAVGVIILIDASMLYREFMADNADRFNSSDGRPSQGEFGESSRSIERTNNGSSSSRFFVPSEGVRWDVFLRELILMWKTIVKEESQYSRERKRSHLPCVVLFTKADLLPDDEVTVTAFKSECNMTCLSPEVRADIALFISPVTAPPQEVRELQQKLAELVYERIVQGKTLVETRSRGKGSIMLHDTHAENMTEPRKRGTCCSSSS